MFTRDGELREEYRRAEAEVDENQSADSEGAAQERAAGAEGRPAEAAEQEPFRRQEPSKPTLYDLVGALAQPIALYLGDAKLPDGQTMENLDLARLHIDLLDLLEEKTQGNLTSEESSFLNDLLYQLRLRYVEKRG